jgi:hypothetical protein
MNKRVEYFKGLLLKEGHNALKSIKYLSIGYDDILMAYDQVGMEPPIKLLRNTNRYGFAEHGWGNGYVLVVEGHEFHGKHYDEIDVSVHGGLTFSQDIPEGDKYFSKGYWVGFDTAHYGDNLEKWSKNEVFNETIELFNQIYQISL